MGGGAHRAQADHQAETGNRFDPGSAVEQALYKVKVTDQDGKPVPGCVLNFCTEEACAAVICDDRGVAEYKAEPYAYRVQVLSLPDGYDFDGGDELFVKAAGDEITITVTRIDG